MAANEINASTATIGEVLESKRLIDLPLVGRSAYDLINTQPGVINFQGSGVVNINGQAGGAVMYTTDGINTQDNLLNGAQAAANFMSIDRTEEFRVVTSPADVEYGRGSGQVQMSTRAGSNRFVGSAWDELRNTDLDANDWFNNQKGNNAITGAPAAPRNILIENQYGVRFGGPVMLPHYNGHNKTFFNGIWEQSNEVTKNTVNSVVYTPTALAGQYRYITGATNANAAAVVPTVTTAGQPLVPANDPAGVLMTQNLYATGNAGRTAQAPLFAKYIGIMPLPNNYLVGDGLNTAGFTWAAPSLYTTQLFEGRIDHVFNDKERLFISLNHQSGAQHIAGAFPMGPDSAVDGNENTGYTAHLTSIIRPNLLNEATFGVFRPRVPLYAAYDPASGPEGQLGQSLLPVLNNVPFALTLASGVSAPVAASSASGTSNRITQNWDYGDAITYIRGKHSFKAGATLRFIDNSGYELFGTTPTATVGNGAVASVGITTLPGIGANSTGATNLLNDLTGTLSGLTSTLNAGSATSPYTPGLSRYSDLLERQADVYFKDDWKITPSLTINLGVRWDFYGVPYDGIGHGQSLAGMGNSIFGISGNNFSSLFAPGVMNGSLTQIVGIGPKTANPNQNFFNEDYHNFSPGVGLAWSVPGGKWSWLTGGKDKTVVRMGYGIFPYVQTDLYVLHVESGYEPNGLSTATNEVSTSLLTLQNASLPLVDTAAPFALNALNGGRTWAKWLTPSPRIW